MCDYGRVKAWIHMGGGIAGVLNYGDGLGRKELVMIDIYPWASESFGHRKYIKIELMTHLEQQRALFLHQLTLISPNASGASQNGHKIIKLLTIITTVKELLTITQGFTFLTARRNTALSVNNDPLSVNNKPSRPIQLSQNQSQTHTVPQFFPINNKARLTIERSFLSSSWCWVRCQTNS
jgi:hypothetical protein